MPDNEPNATPAASVAAGQQPTNGTNGTPTTDTASTLTGQPAASQSDTGASNTATETPPEVTNPAAQKAAQEAARYRTELREAQKRIADFEAAQKAAEDAKLSELERAQKAAAEAQAAKDQAILDAQERITRAEVRAEAARIGLNPQLAARIVDYAAITYDDSGDPTNIAQLLSDAINAYGLHPQPAGANALTQNAPVQAPQNVGATNPARPSGPVTISASQYSDPAFRSAYMRDYGEDILTAMNKGKVKLV